MHTSKLILQDQYYPNKKRTKIPQKRKKTWTPLNIKAISTINCKETKFNSTLRGLYNRKDLFMECPDVQTHENIMWPTAWYTTASKSLLWVPLPKTFLT